MAFTSSCSRDLSPPPRMNLETKSVARRVASPSGTPRRRKSLAFILDNRERMAFCYRGYFQLFKQTQNHLFWNGTRAAFVLLENCSDGRLNVNNLNPRCIIGKQVNPALARRSRDVCSVESKVLTSAQMLTAFLSRGLDDFALIVRCLNIERVADGIQRNHRQRRPVFGEPCILTSARQARHKRHRAAV